jgi:hypothetical protein
MQAWPSAVTSSFVVGFVISIVFVLVFDRCDCASKMQSPNSTLKRTYADAFETRTARRVGRRPPAHESIQRIQQLSQ